MDIRLLRMIFANSGHTVRTSYNRKQVNILFHFNCGPVFLFCFFFLSGALKSKCVCGKHFCTFIVVVIITRVKINMMMDL